MPVRKPIRPASSTGQDTRKRLLEVAAKHFAEHGYKGASQRAIQRELGMNPGTAHYYFGSKEALYRGVIDASIHDIQEERLKRLEEIEPSLVGHERLERLLYSYFYPHLRFTAMDAGRDYATILAQVQSGAKDVAQEIFDETVRPVRQKYLAALQKLFPAKTPTEVDRALSLAVALMAVVATWRRKGKVEPEDRAHEWALELSTYAAAGFTALFGAVTKPRARAAAR
jgi:TetR/AcrR family transcriptional regulator, regulator of cefoperazone and chloramphenicol sensitivity